MTARMREYETLYIMRPELDDNAAKDLMLAKKELIEKMGGKNLKVDAVARRKLAWDTQKQSRGIYVVHQFLAPPSVVKDFDRALSIDDNILLRQSVLLNRDVDPETAQIQEDILVAPVYKEKREYAGGRGRFGGDHDGDFDNRRSRYDSDGYDDLMDDDDN